MSALRERQMWTQQIVVRRTMQSMNYIELDDNYYTRSAAGSAPLSILFQFQIY